MGRDVAIKVLSDTVATDPDRLARFEREAQLLASLNHSNIAIIHGFEDANGVRALVMELVDGPTLAERIALGRFPLMTRWRSRGKSAMRSRRLAISTRWTISD